MNRYRMIRGLRAPAFLLLIGVLALLNQRDILRGHQSWPLLLILWGVFLLAERAALASEENQPSYPGSYSGGYPGSYPGSGVPYTGGGNPAQPTSPDAGTAIVPGYTAIVPTHSDEFKNDGGEL